MISEATPPERPRHGVSRRWPRRAIHGGCVLLAVALVVVLALLPRATPTAAGQSLGQHLYMVDMSGNLVRYDATTGAHPRVVYHAETGTPIVHIITGPDDRVYASRAGQILRFAGSSGRYIDTLGLGGEPEFVQSMAFGRAGTLFVLDRSLSTNTARILRYRASDGALLGVLIDNLLTPYPTPGAPVLREPVQIEFGPDGKLYLLDDLAHVLVRFDPSSGAFLGTVIAPDTRIFYGSGFAFGPDHSVYVSEGLRASLDNLPRRVFRYSPSGQFSGAFIEGVDWPSGLMFGHDGALYVTSNASLLRYDGASGTLLGSVVIGQLGGSSSTQLGPQSFSFAGRPHGGRRAGMTVAQTLAPALQARRGGIIADTIVATNRGHGAAGNVVMTLAFDPALVQVLDAKLSKPGAWVSRRGDDSLELQSGVLLSDGDVMTATVRLLVRDTAPIGAALGPRLTYEWTDEVGGGVGASNQVRLVVGKQEQGAAVLSFEVRPLSAPSGSARLAHAAGLLPSEPLALWVNTPAGTAIALGRATSGPDGSLDLDLATAALAPGWHSVVVRGLWSDQTLVGAFEVR
jgi:hypothetical protein